MKMDALAIAPEAPVVRLPVLNICLSSGTGEGPTELAAFDAALTDAGVANYNLLCLSSVIPPMSTIVRARHRTLPDDHGRRLYVVMSQMRQSVAGCPAHAGIGWVQQANNGPGLFVELHDDKRDRLETNLHDTLNAMRAYRTIDFGPVQTEIASATCSRRPVCALVVAVFACEPW
jgi:arginine decarboxylase